jgi:protease I
MKPMSGHRILIFVADDYEDLELWYPKLRFIEAGATVTVAGPAARTTYTGKHGYPAVSDAAIADVRAEDFDGVVLVGGWMPDAMRRDAKVLSLVGKFNEAGKLIAAICHGPQISISAGICKGVRMTSTPGIKDDLINAGAIWSDEPVVVDRHHVTSRRPADLPDFCERCIDFLTQGRR